MTPEEIKKNAPDGANRYYQCELGVFYFKKQYIYWWYWCDLECMWFKRKIPLDFRLKTKPLP